VLKISVDRHLQVGAALPNTHVVPKSIPMKKKSSLWFKLLLPLALPFIAIPQE
jgi:hypothetical protein